MRCARCDQVALPQVLARTRDGRLVFGWCPQCLESEGCELVEVEPAALAPPRPLPLPLARRLRRSWLQVRRWFRRPRSQASSRRMGTLGIAGLMAAWALILAFIGGLKVIGAGDARGLMLLSGGGLMAMTSLGIWIGMIPRGDRPAVILKVAKVSAVVVAVGTLIWGGVRKKPGDWTPLMGVAIAGLAVASLVTLLERRRTIPRKDREKPRRVVP
jgi:hypothetical protein